MFFVLLLLFENYFHIYRTEIKTTKKGFYFSLEIHVVFIRMLKNICFYFFQNKNKYKVSFSQNEHSKHNKTFFLVYSSVCLSFFNEMIKLNMSVVCVNGDS